MPKMINSGFNNLNIPKDIKIPFPLKISSYDLLPRADNKRIPNAFIIYRKSLNRELISKGYKFSLPQLSTMASNAWKNELNEVKQAYVNLVNDAKALYKGLQSNSNNAMTNDFFSVSLDDQNLNTLNAVAQLHTYPSENMLFLNSLDNYQSSFNDLIIPEDNNGNNNIDERIRILEERQKLLAEQLGIQFQ